MRRPLVPELSLSTPLNIIGGHNWKGSSRPRRVPRELSCPRYHTIIGLAPDVLPVVLVSLLAQLKLAQMEWWFGKGGISGTKRVVAKRLGYLWTARISHGQLGCLEGG